MFAALEVAEIHEALEQSRAANGEVTGPSPSKDVKGRAPGHKPQAKVEAKGHRKKKGNPNSKSDWWSQGWDGWNSGWWESEKSTARWQKRPAESETAQREAWAHVDRLTPPNFPARLWKMARKWFGIGINACILRCLDVYSLLCSHSLCARLVFLHDQTRWICPFSAHVNCCFPDFNKRVSSCSRFHDFCAVLAPPFATAYGAYLNLVSQSDEDLSTGPRSSKCLRGAEFHWSVIFLRILNFCLRRCCLGWEMRWMHCKSSWRFLAFWDLGSYRTAICDAKNPQISLRSLKEIGGLAADLSCSKGLSRDWPCRRLRWQYVMTSPILDDCESSSSSSNLGCSRAPDLWAQVLLVVFFLYWFGIVHSPPSAGPCCRTLCGEQRGQEPNAKVVESLSHHLALWRISIKYQVVDYDLRIYDPCESVLACLIIYNYI